MAARTQAEATGGVVTVRKYLHLIRHLVGNCKGAFFKSCCKCLSVSGVHGSEEQHARGGCMAPSPSSFSACGELQVGVLMYDVGQRAIQQIMYN